MRSIVTLIAILALAGCATTAQQDEAIPRSTTANTPVEIHNFLFFNGYCESTVEASVAQAPKNGRVDITPSTRVIPKKVSIGSSESCAGQEIPSRLVTYTPNPGFTGRDDFVIGVGWHSGGKSFRYEVTVR
ncbi:MAG: hypothetical protein AAF493_22180 [Pseudomonadota bacterium]